MILSEEVPIARKDVESEWFQKHNGLASVNLSKSRALVRFHARKFSHRLAFLVITSSPILDSPAHLPTLAGLVGDVRTAVAGGRIAHRGI